MKGLVLRSLLMLALLVAAAVWGLSAMGVDVTHLSPERLRTAVLVHLSEINNLTPLARDTVQWALDREGISHVAVHAVRPNGASRTYELQ